jgi:hypothetical protein
MTFFYDLNKRLATLASKQDAEQLAEHSAPVAKSKSKLAESMGVAEADYSAKKAAAGQDIGKPGKNFAKIAKSAGAKYGSKAAGERVAGAVLNKLRAKESVQEGHCSACNCSPCECNSMEESALQAYIGDKKYGKAGMDALRKAGREGASKDKMSQIRNRYNKMDEADMEEGNAFTAALKATPKGGKFKVGNKEFTDTSDLEEGFKEMDAWMTSREKEKGTGKFDKKERTLPNGMKATTYTRKHEDDVEDDKDAPEDKGGVPKKKGRPKGKDKGPERVTAKSYKYKAGRPSKTKEDLDVDGVMMTRPSNMSSEGVDPSDRGEYDQEGESAKHDIKTIVRHAQALHKILGDDDNLPEWVQSKLAKIEGMMIAVDEYMQNQDQEVSEEGLEKHSISALKSAAGKNRTADQKSGVPANFSTAQLKAELAKRTKGKVQEAGKPDFLDLDKDGDKTEPMKKAAKEKKVDETTVSGSVSTAPAGKKSSGGYNFGGGVYEGFNNQVESMITEGMNVSVNMSTDANGQASKNITVSAEGDDADQLAALLKMAGLHGQAEQSCGTCGNTPCGCEQTVDEAYGDTDETLNNPDWPTDTETLAAEPNLRTYSGGPNGPKSTGQTTVPVVASQLRRQASMEESVELERSLFKTWKNYKG